MNVLVACEESQEGEKTVAEYIEREAAKAAVCLTILHDGIRDALKINIDDVPAADVVPVRHGRWLHDGTPKEMSYLPWYCSECGEYVGKHQTLYCPWCGAQMDLEASNVCSH